MLSLIIPTHRRIKPVLRLVESLKSQTFQDFEILVVSNFNDKKLASALASKEKVRHLTSGQRGANAARNLGAKESQGDILVFLDDDCSVDDENYLQKIKEAHSTHPNAAAIGGRYELKPFANSFERTYHELADQWLMNSVADDKKSLNLVGGNVSYKRKKFMDYHGFNEKIDFGGAETDFHRRLSAGGEELLLDKNLFVTHHIELGPRLFLRKAFYQGRSYEVREKKKLNVSLPKKSKRPPRFLEKVYDYSFNKGREWAKGHDDYETPKTRQWVAKLIGL